MKKNNYFTQYSSVIEDDNDCDLIPEKPEFFQSFLDVIEVKEELDPVVEESMKESSFRKKIQSLHCNYKLVEEIAPYVRHTILKPQKLITDSVNYYVAIDSVTNTYYICYRNLLMIDIDLYKENDGGNSIPIEDLLPHCRCQIQSVIEKYSSSSDNIPSERKALWKNEKYCNNKNCLFRYRVFKSRNGYHAFLISHEADRLNEVFIQLMIEANTDFFYIIFSYLRSWCVRLNRKPGENPDQLYTFVGDVVKGKMINPTSMRNSTIIVDELEKLVQLHLNLANNVFINAPPCLDFRNIN